MVAETQCLKLLGIAFDSQLTFCQQIRQSALRATQRLGFLKKASAVLDPGCRLTVYNGFVCPVLEHGMLVWMGASQTVLAQLDAVQRRALHLIRECAYLPSLELRRKVAALCYLYKIHYLTGPQMLTRMLPPSQAVPDHDQHSANTRQQARVAAGHRYQLQSDIPANSRNNVRRSFPEGVLDTWNQLPRQHRLDQPDKKRLQSFKCIVHRFLRSSHWDWATDRL